MGGNTCCLDAYKPVIAMVVVQFIYAGMALSAKAAFREGMNTMVFVVYRQAIASLVLAPSTLLAKGGNFRQTGISMRAFGMVFVAALVGATLNQYLYYQGLDLASSSMATAMTNLIPAITFVMAASIGLEKVKWSVRSAGKVIGTLICVGGATCMALYKGPRLLNMTSSSSSSSSSLLTMLLSASSNSSGDWVAGGLFLITSTCCWSFWLILQVPICKHYLDPLSLSAWMCVISTVQSALLTFLLHPNLTTWKITSLFQLLCCVFAGIFGSGVTFYLQSWSISIRGPLFSALFNPLSTVITTIFDALVLRQKLYIGSLVGAGAVMGGLYIVLWGKANDLDPMNKSQARVDHDPNDVINVTIIVDKKRSGNETDVTKPLIDRGINDV